ncbi:hypothetical protein FOA52_014128 [Chlamydomonas sp. UWO 241]|nr:hypothetical protein FOA52_014128 [Chlamydomonas sp. UWO 241]
MCECPPCDNCGGQCSCTCNSDFEERACPAVLVAMGARLIAQHVRVNNHNGTGVQVRPGGAAFLRACTLGYKAPKRTSDRSNMFKTDIGVQALTGSTLAMYDCKVEHATWGVSAGAGATVLAQYNTFAKITRGSLLPAHLFAPGSFGHGDASADAAAASAPSVVVQPWRDGWARGAPASPASPLCSVSV